MRLPPPKKILYQSTDCFGHLWNVTESRPTEHGWGVLLGFPIVNASKPKGMMGPARVILTPELCSYLEEFRMKRSAVRLPVSATAICKLRRALGMNYWQDCKKWWKKTEDAITSDPASLRDDAPLKPKNLTWTRGEIQQCRELLDSGMSTAEIGNILGRKEKAVFKLRLRLFGIKRRFWTTEEKETLFAAMQKNLPHAEIAEQLGRSESAIGGMYNQILRRSRKRLEPPKE